MVYVSNLDHAGKCYNCQGKINYLSSYIVYNGPHNSPENENYHPFSNPQFRWEKFSACPLQLIMQSSDPIAKKLSVLSAHILLPVAICRSHRRKRKRVLHTTSFGIRNFLVEFFSAFPEYKISISSTDLHVKLESISLWLSVINLFRESFMYINMYNYTLHLVLSYIYLCLPADIIPLIDCTLYLVFSFHVNLTLKRQNNYKYSYFNFSACSAIRHQERYGNCTCKYCNFHLTFSRQKCQISNTRGLFKEINALHLPVIHIYRISLK